MENDIIISVVVPVYNAEKYLARCINSILCQKTSVKYEAIFVNDGSTDNSLNILKNIQDKEKRIIIINQPNGGVSLARNTGIDNARGKYVAFVDSDDWIDPLYLQNLYNAIETNLICLVVEGCIQETPKGSLVNKYINGVYNAKDFNRLFGERNLNVKGVPWGKLYDLSVIKEHNLRFEKDLSFCEDFIFMLYYLYYVDRVVFIDSTDYHYVKQVGNSLVNRFYCFEKEYLGFETVKRVFDLLISKFDVAEYKYWAAFLALRSIRTIYRPGYNYLTRKKRIICLKKFTENDIKLITCHSKIRNNKLGRIVSFCLMYKRYQILDLLLWFSITLKNETKRFFS